MILKKLTGFLGLLAFFSLPAFFGVSSTTMVRRCFSGFVKYGFALLSAGNTLKRCVNFATTPPTNESWRTRLNSDRSSYEVEKQNRALLQVPSILRPRSENLLFNFCCLVCSCLCRIACFFQRDKADLFFSYGWRLQLNNKMAVNNLTLPSRNWESVEQKMVV